MRVLYLAHVAQQSGGEIALLRLLEALRGTEVEPHVILGEDGLIRQQLEQMGISTEVIPLGDSARNVRKDSLRNPFAGLVQVRVVLAYAEVIRRRIEALEIDVVHTNSLKSGVYGGLASRRARVPMVWHLRDRLSADYLPPFAILLVRTAIATLATRTVCNSYSTLSTLTRWPFQFLARRSEAVSSPLPDVLDGTSVRRRTRLHETSRPLRYVMVGRLAPWKGQSVTIEAFGRADLGDATLTIVGSAMFGEDEYADRLVKQRDASVASSRIEFLGFQENVVDLLADYDVLVHASITPEPFGQVVVEGLAAGLAVIVAGAGGPAEIITNGVDGLHHDPGNVTDLAHAMQRLHDDDALRRSLRRAGTIRSFDYAPQTIANQMVEIYLSCMPLHVEKRPTE